VSCRKELLPELKTMPNIAVYNPAVVYLLQVLRPEKFNIL
jgi:hypothetical protein